MKDFIKEFAEAKEYKVCLYYNTYEDYYLSFSSRYIIMMGQKKYELIKSFE